MRVSAWVWFRHTQPAEVNVAPLPPAATELAIAGIAGTKRTTTCADAGTTSFWNLT